MKEEVKIPIYEIYSKSGDRIAWFLNEDICMKVKKFLNTEKYYEKQKLEFAIEQLKIATEKCTCWGEYETSEQIKKLKEDLKSL